MHFASHVSFNPQLTSVTDVFIGLGEGHFDRLREEEMAVVEKYCPRSGTPGVDSNSLEFLRRMASLVPGIIYVFNHKTQSNEYSNRSMAQLLGYTSEEVIAMGDTIIEKCVHVDDLPGLVRYFQSLEHVEQGHYVAHEYRDYAKDGTVVWLRSIDTPFERDADGSLVRHIGIAFDITAEKEAQENLRKVNRELEDRVAERTAALSALNQELENRVTQRTSQLVEANRELEQLSYVATHDLKVPINNMVSLTHMLHEVRDRLPAEHQETLAWMHEVCEQASRKLESLVCVTQANAVWDAPFVDVELAGTLHHVLSALRYQLREANAEVSQDFQANTVRFLPHEVENLFQVLLSNAIKFRDTTRPLRISVKSWVEDEYDCLSVADNGSGVNLPEEYDKVFGLFQSAHADPDGAGVALYSLRRMMDRIGGSITASGLRGQGCTFEVKFPRQQEQGL